MSLPQQQLYSPLALPKTGKLGIKGKETKKQIQT
jgi:hypothetical protein